MATDCKKPFQISLPKEAVLFFLSIIGHLAIFVQISHTLSSGTFDKLLGKKGGPAEATEVSFFPNYATGSSNQSARTGSSLDVSSARETGPSDTTEGSQTKASRGIGEGGTSTQYHSVLHAYLDSAKVFPRSLRELGLSGVVRVRFQVNREGYLEKIELADAQAPALLQNEALRFLRKLERVPVPPTELTDNQLQFELPLRYELKS